MSLLSCDKTPQHERSFGGCGATLHAQGDVPWAPGVWQVPKP